MQIKLHLLVAIVGLLGLAAAPAAEAAAAPSVLSDGLQFFRDEWAKFKATHKRTYPTLAEAGRRFGIFVENVRSVLKHNGAFQSGNATFEQHVNLFADRTVDEVNRERNGFNYTEAQRAWQLETAGAAQQTTQLPSHSRRRRDTGAPLPAEVNWVTKGVVAPVLDQRDCGGCYAFASAAAMESMYAIRGAPLVQLSPQQVIDCSGSYGNKGCDGGIMQYTYAYVRQNGGLTSLAEYPYYAKQYQCRSYDRNYATVAGSARVPQGDEAALMRAVAEHGPVAVAIDGEQRGLHFYRGGVYYDQGCSRSVPNHGVLVVGYGRDAQTGLDYWLIKNSWGAQWGEQGYVRMARNQRNMCCITCNAVYPTV